MELVFSAKDIIDLITLTGLEVILGIDNVIFIALLVHHLPPKKRNKARIFGLSLALILRILMLFGAAWIIKLREPLFTLYGFSFSGRNLLLILGGLFLVIKAFLEIKELFSDQKANPSTEYQEEKYTKIITQIIFVDLILSFDSIITAVGMTDHMMVIIISILIAMAVMLLSSQPIGEFIYRNPSIKIVALYFIALIGVMLIVNGFDYEFPKELIYLTLLFSLVVETTNVMLNKKKNEKNK